MAYTKYSLTPANNNATPPDGAPEGMLPSAVNDTMRDMMSQIRDVGDGIRDGTYTMTAPKITGGTITGATVTSNTFSSSGATITGGSINNTPIGASTANTGAFTTLSASGNVNFDSGTFFVDSATNNVGIGTNNPDSVLHVDKSGVSASLRIGFTGASQNFYDADTQFFRSGNGTERMRIASNGNVGIGTSNPVANIEIKSNGFGTILTTADGAGFSGEGAVEINQKQNITYTAMRFLNNNYGVAVGNIVCTTSATSFNSLSDYRLKENIEPMIGALAKVAALKPVTYNWKIDGSKGQGFIAHELQSVVPDCVTGEKNAVDKDGKPIYQGVDTSFLVATLTAAIQEQQAIINDLKTRIETLENNG